MPDDENQIDLAFHLDEEAKKLIASCTNENSLEAYTSDDLKQAVIAAGFGQYRLNPTQLEVATTKIKSGLPFELPIGDIVDGKFTLHTDMHQMAVYLNYTLPQGGEPVLPAAIQEDATAKGITVPLNAEVIEQTLREGGINIVIGEGLAPVKGNDARLDRLIPNMKERHPVLDEHGLADFHELGDILTVKAGEALLRRIPPTEGTPGYTVMGKPLPAKPGKDLTFATKMDGAQIDPNDPDVLIATISGCPKILKNGVTVDPVYTVKDVDLHGGNISYEGTVHVTGDVHAHMTVQCSGDIYVDGTVESAMLHAGGDIVVKGGIFGSSEVSINRNEKFDPAVVCEGNCTARFAQNAHITAGQGIFLHDVAMLCELTAGHQVVVGDEGSRKGEIIGGTTRASMLIKAKHIGSPEFLKTLVICKASPKLLERQSNAIKAREAAQHKLADLIKLLELDKLHPGRLPPAAVQAAQETRDAMNDEIEALRAEEEAIHEEVELCNKAQVIVEKRVYGGSEVHIGMKHYQLIEDREGGLFHLDEDGNISFD